MIRVSAAAIDAGEALSAFCAGRNGAGAVASFVGLARGEPAGGVALELEAYPGFTEAAIARFAGEVGRRFGLQDLAILHRIGPIVAGETIVAVMTAAAHRRAAFEACDCLMDWLKSRAPLWKKEYGPEGARWVEPTTRDHADLERWETQR